MKTNGIVALSDFEIDRVAGGKSVVVIDYGVKRNILRALASTGAKITVVPATTTAEEVLARNPDEIAVKGVAPDARVALVDPFAAASEKKAGEAPPPPPSPSPTRSAK